MPLISVIMSVKNDFNNYLSESLSSILSQTLLDFELIIIADGSDEKTLSVLNSYKINDRRINIIKHKNIGLTKSLNIGIKNSNSDLILRHDYDDISVINRFQIQYQYMIDNPHVAVLGSNCIKINNSGNKIGKIITEINYKKIKKKILYFNPIIHPTVIFRKNILKKYNYYNEKYKVSQDYELWSRVSKDYQIHNINLYLLKLRLHDNSISRNHNLLQRKFSFIINLTNKFQKYKSIIEKNINQDPVNFYNTLNIKDQKLLNFTNSRLYVLLYDRISIFSIFKYNILTILLIIQYYYKRPKYLILRFINI